MTAEKRSIVVHDVVQVGDDDYAVTLILSRPPQPALDRDMDIIKAEISRLLPGWIKPKIQAGDP
jgi:hypothetical protein